MTEVIDSMNKEMSRLKAYFPFRIVWGAINPVTSEYVTGATVTKRQINDYARKGWEAYIFN